MQLTLRQRQRVLSLLALWGLLTLLCAVTGPFGTHDVMGFGGRATYWGVVVAGSILGSALVARVVTRSMVQELVLWLVFSAALALGVHLLNVALFPADATTGGLLYLFGVVAAVVGVVNGMLYLARKTLAPAGAEPGTPDPTLRFLRRLPLEHRGPLVRIEAQDHYLNVVTTKGSALVLMRLSEAIDELEGARGLQTHRSHWVALDAVSAHKRREGRDLLILSDGAEVPVARTRRQAAKDAGLF